jgi:hypothetical protein
VELTEKTCFLHKKHIGSREAPRLFAHLAAQRQDRLKLVLDFHWEDAQREHNIVTRDHGVPFAAARPEILDAFIHRLGQRPRSVVIDHHFPFDVLATVNTTILVTRLLERLHEQAQPSLVDALQSAVIFSDHADADVVLAALAVRRAGDRAFFVHHGELMRQAAMNNDFVSQGTGRSWVLNYVMQAFESQVERGELSFEAYLERASDLVEHAAGLPAATTTETYYRDLTDRGPAGPFEQAFLSEYAQSRRIFERLKATSGGYAVTPARHVLLVDTGRDVVENSVVAEFFQNDEAGAALARDKAAILLTYIVAKPGKPARRMYKWRSLIRDGADPFNLFALYEALWTHHGFPRHHTFGRHTAGGLTKDGVPVDQPEVWGDEAGPGRLLGVLDRVVEEVCRIG